MLENTQRVEISLEPLDDFLVIQPTEDESETRSGLIIPATAVSRDAGCRSGIVTATGPDVTGVEPGDKVLFPADAGYEIRGLRVVRREDLIARIDP